MNNLLTNYMTLESQWKILYCIFKYLSYKTYRKYSHNNDKYQCSSLFQIMWKGKYIKLIRFFISLKNTSKPCDHRYLFFFVLYSFFTFFFRLFFILYEPIFAFFIFILFSPRYSFVFLLSFINSFLFVFFLYYIFSFFFRSIFILLILWYSIFMSVVSFEVL